MLACHPACMDRRDTLLSQNSAEYTAQDKQRLVYVGQAELAHATPKQVDILVSDKATTCCIVALRSTSSNKSVLCTMTHLDTTLYESCIHEAVQAHCRYHAHSSKTVLKVHVVGGHANANALSQWILRVFADAADLCQASVRVVLGTVCTGHLNGEIAPAGRGLALECATGRVSLALCHHDSLVPAASLRGARLWTTTEQPQRLAVIHTADQDDLLIPLFSYQRFPALDALLTLSDAALLEQCSTSPDCEEPDFCGRLRATLRWIRHVPCEAVFPHELPLAFCRHGFNEWRLKRR